MLLMNKHNYFNLFTMEKHTIYSLERSNLISFPTSNNPSQTMGLICQTKQQWKYLYFVKNSTIYNLNNVHNHAYHACRDPKWPTLDAIIGEFCHDVIYKLWTQTIIPILWCIKLPPKYKINATNYQSKVPRQC